MDNEDHSLIEIDPLTDWKKEPIIQDLQADFEIAQTSQSLHITDIKRWRALRDITDEAKPPKVKGRSSVQPKLIRRQAEWRYSALTEPFLGSEKMYSITPVTFEDAKSAEQNQLVLNWQFRTKLNHIKFIDEYVRTTVDEGTGIVRLGWCRVTRIVKKDIPIWDYIEPETEEDLAEIKDIIELAENDWNNFLNMPMEAIKAYEYFTETGLPVLARDSGETETIEEEIVVVNQPTLQIMNPENVFVDPSCEGDLDKAKFVICSFETSHADLKKDGKYKNLDKVNWESQSIVAAVDHQTSSSQTENFKDTLRKRVVAYEYWGMWDINDDNDLKPIVATWIGGTMIRMEENPFPDEKPPFVIVPYLPVKRSIYGETDAELLEDNQKILGAVTRGMIDLMARSANGQLGMAKGMLDYVNQKRFDNGQDYQFNPTINPANGVIEHKYPELSKSALDMLGIQNAEAEALTGVKAFSGGMSGNAYGEVAAGIRGMLDAASKREMAILRRLAKGIQEIGSKIIMMNQAFLSEEEVIRVTNETFVKVRREDLAGAFDLIVDISTAEVDNAKAVDLGFMLQTMGPNMDFSITKMIFAKIAKLKRMPELAEEIMQYEPQPDPLEQKLKEMEVAKVEAEIAKIQSEIDLNKAKAREAMSKADMNDLEFVQEETGTNHERDLEKQREQSRGNQDLAITNALVDKKKPDEQRGDIAAGVGYNKVSDGNKQRGNVTDLRQAQVPMPRQVGQPVTDPSQNLGSKYWTPSTDPALNPAINLG